MELIIAAIVIGGSALSAVAKAWKDREESKRRARNTQVPRQQRPLHPPARPLPDRSQPSTKPASPLEPAVPVAPTIRNAEPVKIPGPIHAPPVVAGRPLEPRRPRPVRPPASRPPRPDRARRAAPPERSIPVARRADTPVERPDSMLTAAEASRRQVADSYAAIVARPLAADSTDPRLQERRSSSSPVAESPDDGWNDIVHPSRRTLRRAILLNEILSPPLSLRPPQE